MTIPQAFNQYRDSDGIALQCGSVTMTYRELIRDAEAAAAALMAHGIHKGDRILIDMGRSADYIRIWLGTIMAGAVAVTLHPAWPESMKETVRQACGASLYVTDETARDLIREAPEAAISIPDFPVLSDEDPAVICYTSGSTGEPKGVVITHGTALAHTGDPNRDDLVYHFRKTCESIFLDTSLSFAAAVYILFLCFLGGKRLVLAEDADCRDARARGLCMMKHHAESILTSPSFFLQNRNEPEYIRALSGAKTVLVSTEAITPRTAFLLRGIAGDALMCCYGSSEAGGCLMYHRGVTDGKTECGYTNTRAAEELHVLDGEGREAKEGELCLGGAAGRQGSYYGDPELTARKYKVHPAFGRLLHTGDLAERQDDGTIVIRGRIDSMIKLHGLRIEPGSIEKVMEGFPGIEKAAVRLSGSGADAVLCGWYTAGEAVDEAALRLYLTEKLPYYTVPGRLLRIDAMPLTTSGKLDRRKLPEIEAGASAYQAPQNEKEKILCEVFAEVLERDDPVGVTDSFFALGGSSLTGMQAASTLLERGWRIEMKDLFSAPNVAALAGRMIRAEEEQGEAPRTETALTPAQQAAAEATVGADRIACIHPATSFMERLIRNRDPWMMIEMRETDEAIPADLFRERVRKAVDAHETLRSVFLCPEGELPVQAVLHSRDHDVFSVDLRPLQEPGRRISDRQKRYFSGLGLLDATGEKDFERKVLFRAGLVRVAEERSVIYVAYSHLLLDAIGIDNVMMELLGRNRITADGEMFHRREERLCHADETEAMDFWNRQPGFGKEPARLPAPKRPEPNAGVKFLSVAQGSAFHNRMKEACRRRGLTVAALVHHALGQALCELLDREDCRFSTISSGRTAEEIRLPGMFAYPYLFCSARGETAEECRKRLLEAQDHTWIFGKSGIESAYPGRGGVFLDMVNISADEHKGIRRLKPAEVMGQVAITRLGADLINRDVTGDVSLYFDTAGDDLSFWGTYHAGRCDTAAVYRLVGLIRKNIESELEK